MRHWRTRTCDLCGIPRTLHFNQFGVIDCTITREQAKEAAAYITALVCFLTLAELARRNLPLRDDTPIQKLVSVGPATI